MDIISIDKIKEMSIQCELNKKKQINLNKNINSMRDWWDNIPKIDKKEGFVINYPHGRVVKQIDNSDYYRGENQFYDSSPSSFMRRKKEYSSEDLRIEIFILDMKIYEFKNLIYKFEHVKKWEEQNADILVELIAQHYGIATRWIDITNNFDIALFFACCRWNSKQKKWEPIFFDENDEIDDKNKYGTIFVQNHSVAKANLANTSRPLNSYEHVILPIGFQPFMRCHMQSGYAIYSDNYYDLRSDLNFKILKFTHSKELSEWIYNKMEQGRIIYPYEGLLDCDEQIEIIRETNLFSEEAFDYAFKKNNEWLCNDKKIKDILSIKNIKISESPINISQEIIDKIDYKYKDINPLDGIESHTILSYL